jgi:hypothetical protein
MSRCDVNFYVARCHIVSARARPTSVHAWNYRLAHVALTDIGVFSGLRSRNGKLADI